MQQKEQISVQIVAGAGYVYCYPPDPGNSDGFTISGDCLSA